jgi:hypothetical protein
MDLSLRASIVRVDIGQVNDSARRHPRSRRVQVVRLAWRRTDAAVAEMSAWAWAEWPGDSGPRDDTGVRAGT